MSERFWVPDALLNTKVSPTAKLLYVLICRSTSARKPWDYTLDQIGEILGVDERSVRRALDVLKPVTMVDWHRSTKGVRVNVYTPLPARQWKREAFRAPEAFERLHATCGAGSEGHPAGCPAAAAPGETFKRTLGPVAAAKRTVGPVRPTPKAPRATSKRTQGPEQPDIRRVGNRTLMRPPGIKAPGREDTWKKKAPAAGQTASSSGPLPCPPGDRNSKAEAVTTFDAFWRILPKRISTGRARVDAFQTWKLLAPAVRHQVHVCVAESLAWDDDAYGLYAYDGRVRFTPAELIPLAQRAGAEGRLLWDVLPEEPSAPGRPSLELLAAPFKPLDLAAVASVPPAPREHQAAEREQRHERVLRLIEEGLSSRQAEDHADAEAAERLAQRRAP